MTNFDPEAAYWSKSARCAGNNPAYSHVVQEVRNHQTMVYDGARLSIEQFIFAARCHRHWLLMR